jgi:hypothetical protein
MQPICQNLHTVPNDYQSNAQKMKITGSKVAKNVLFLIQKVPKSIRK